MQTTRALLTPITQLDGCNINKGVKISVIGCGQVGMASVFAILYEKICSQLHIIDLDEDRAKGEAMDISHGCPFINGCPRVTSSNDYSSAEGSTIIVVTAGARTKPGETRLDLIQRNFEIFKNIIPPLAESSPNAIFVIVSNPCDILAFITMKLSKFPPNRIIGAGCNLDTARFRYLVADRLGIPTYSVNGMVIGEHGDTLVPIWSSLNIGGVRLSDINPDIGTDKDSEQWKEIHTNLTNSAYEVRRLKGFTNWGIAISVGHICSVIIRDSREVIPVSTYVKSCSKQGVDRDVYLSLPVVLGANGVLFIVKQTLTDLEKQALQLSANTLYDIQKGIQIDD